MPDGGLLALFVAATFLGAFVAGLAGFAFGLVAAAWLHMLTPLQAATLIVCFGLIIQATRYGSCATRSMAGACCRW
jgi:hypothetical protein